MANQFVAYQDERHGLGAWVAEQIAADLFRYGHWVDEKGAPVLDESGKPDLSRSPPPASPMAQAYGASLTAAGRSSYSAIQYGNEASAADRTGASLDFAYRTWTSPRADAAATFSAVIGQQAQVGVVPLYNNDRSFNKDVLGALMDFPQNKILREYVAESNYVLAAPADLVHEIEQSGFTDSFSPTGSTATFSWNRDKQLRYLRKVTTIFASSDAMRHCAAALDGFRAQGIDVQLIPDHADAYREGLRVAAELLDPNRRVETTYSGSNHVRVSRTRGANHTKPLVAVLLSADRAMKADGYNYDSDYVVLEAEMAGADRIRTSFVALKRGAPSICPQHVDPVKFEMTALKAAFAPSAGGGGVDHRALYPIASDRPGPKPVAERPALVRCLYRFDTVGAHAHDYSHLISVLSQQGFSFTTTQLDGRPGHPMVVAVDVPADRWKDMRPVIRELTKLTAWRRLADFPALQPMVKDGAMPKAHGTPAAAMIAQWLGFVGLAVLAYAVFAILFGQQPAG